MKFLAVLLTLFSTSAFAQCAQANQDGTLFWTSDTLETCNGYWLIPATDYASFVSAVQITPSDLATAFTWGFSTVVVLGALSWKVGVALQLIRKA